ncbi:MAG TPA: cbb3-type cytochrome oxidase assembly protein CcoS [Usitatibacteraceae bacterium]|mgnify:FL=1|nr:cbb3-type cytochrome oxidase assembly protein CcoS [Usitatibacteraceae bacterium]
MDILYLLIPVSVAIALVIGAVFWWAMSSGQFDELDREAGAVVEDDESRP